MPIDPEFLIQDESEFEFIDSSPETLALLRQLNESGPQHGEKQLIPVMAGYAGTTRPPKRRRAKPAPELKSLIGDTVHSAGTWLAARWKWLEEHE